MKTEEDLLVVEVSSDSDTGIKEEDPEKSYVNVWQCSEEIDTAIKSSTDLWKLANCCSVIGLKFRSDLRKFDRHLQRTLTDELYGCQAKAFEGLLSKRSRLMIVVNETMNFDLPQIYDSDHGGNVEVDCCPLEIWPHEVPPDVHRKIVMKITQSARKIHYRMENTVDMDLSACLQHAEQFLDMLLAVLMQSSTSKDQMFMDLFHAFCAIVNVQVRSGQGVLQRSMNMLGREVQSQPDGRIQSNVMGQLQERLEYGQEDQIVLPHRLSTCALVKVRRHVMKKTKEQKVYKDGLEAALLGEMLLELPHAVDRMQQHMFAFLVDGTQVTVYHLFMPSMQLSSLHNPTVRRSPYHQVGYNVCNAGAMLSSSRSYDMLRREDRGPLLRAILDIGSLTLCG